MTSNPTPDGRVLSVAFNDLGTVLRLMGVYPNVEGGEGTLVMETVTSEKADHGQFILRNFAIVDEENVAQILGNHQQSRQMISRQNKLAFRSGQIDFIRRADRVEISDAVLAGDTVGGSARGFIYTDSRRYDITGTYVPLFGLNNVMGRLLGPLAGREGEGLFGVTFAVRGPLDKPDFKVNPLSALAPGAFRRMFSTGPAKSRAPTRGGAGGYSRLNTMQSSVAKRCRLAPATTKACHSTFWKCSRSHRWKTMPAEYAMPPARISQNVVVGSIVASVWKTSSPLQPMAR